MRRLLVVLSVVSVGWLAMTPLAQARSKTLTVRSLASIKDVLELTVSQAGQSELRFGNVVSSPIPKQLGPLAVQVNVTSNSGERYQVTQRLSGPLENANGDEIPVENLKFTSSSSKSAGTTVDIPTSASASSQTIFVSDNTGTSDNISVEYILMTPANQAPGDYSMLMTYTVSAL